jgi:NADH:ubiquinone oxidoreductase subunit 6 (subunit J)
MDASLFVFLILAGLTVIGALGTVLMRNIVHSALFLIISLVSVAGIFVMLNADFLFAVQILIYVGAVATLILFGIMLTRGVRGEQPQNNNQVIPAAIMAVILFGAVLVPVIMNTVWPASDTPAPQTTTALLGQELMQTYALPFEIVGVVLLVAMIGAIIVAREQPRG